MMDRMTLAMNPTWVDAQLSKGGLRRCRAKF